MLNDITLRDGPLVVRPMQREDAAGVSTAAYEGDGFYPFSSLHPGDPKYLEEALAERGSGTALPFVIEVDGRIVGSTRFADIRLAHRALEIGWTWYVPRLRRTWLNATVKLLLLTHAFEELDIVRVAFKCDARNAVSRAAIVAIGATQEGVLRQHYRYADGFQRDTVMFSIVRAEWTRVKPMLAGRSQAARHEARVTGATGPGAAQ